MTDAESTQILERIIWPAVEATSFTGFLYAGIMLTSAGPKLLEFNVRLGDPEAQAILYLLDDNLPEILMGVATRQLSSNPLKWRPGVSQCVVAASAGYPGPFRSADRLSESNTRKKRGRLFFTREREWDGADTLPQVEGYWVLQPGVETVWTRPGIATKPWTWCILKACITGKTSDGHSEQYHERRAGT